MKIEYLNQTQRNLFEKFLLSPRSHYLVLKLNYYFIRRARDKFIALIPPTFTLLSISDLAITVFPSDVVHGLIVDIVMTKFNIWATVIKYSDLTTSFIAIKDPNKIGHLCSAFVKPSGLCIGDKYVSKKKNQKTIDRRATTCRLSLRKAGTKPYYRPGTL